MLIVPNSREVTGSMLKNGILTFFSESGSSLHSSAIFLISSEFFASMNWNKMRNSVKFYELLEPRKHILLARQRKYHSLQTSSSYNLTLSNSLKH